MIKFDLFEYYQINKDRNIILSFKGAFSQEILVEIGSMIRKKFEVEREIRKIFGVFVEMSQNIMHYSAEKELGADGNEVGVGIIVFSQEQDSFYITSGNLASNEICDRITSKIDFINTMNADELKQYYNEQRRMPQAEGSKGAGLGLIDIARKSGNQLEYLVSRFDNDNSFIVISVKFSKSEL